MDINSSRSMRFQSWHEKQLGSENYFWKKIYFLSLDAVYIKNEKIFLRSNFTSYITQVYRYYIKLLPHSLVYFLCTINVHSFLRLAVVNLISDDKFYWCVKWRRRGYGGKLVTRVNLIHIFVSLSGFKYDKTSFKIKRINKEQEWLIILRKFTAWSLDCEKIGSILQCKGTVWIWNLILIYSYLYWWMSSYKWNIFLFMAIKFAYCWIFYNLKLSVA